MRELVNQDTHEPVPMEDGAMGMAVFSTLAGRNVLGFRLTLGDIMEVSTQKA